MSKFNFFLKNKQDNLATIQGGTVAREKTAGATVCVENNSGEGTHEWSYTSDVKHNNGEITYKGSTAS